MSLTPLKNGIGLNELDNWGSITDLGSHILAGQVKLSEKGFVKYYLAFA